MKKLAYLTLLMFGLAILTSCDSHIDPLDTSMKVGHVVCTDGNVLPLEQCEALGKEPIAVVFYITRDQTTNYQGFAVYLDETPALAITDSIGIVQKTSCSQFEYDGNQNTYALYATPQCNSPVAEYVFDMWKYGQSAYIPSVAQMNLLYMAKAAVNPVIRLCGGKELPSSPAESWYWTSTEVENQSQYKAWLYSTSSGSMLETPTDQPHRARPIITINIKK